MSNITKNFKPKLLSQRGLRRSDLPEELQDPSAPLPRPPRKPGEYKFADGGPVFEDGLVGTAEGAIRKRRRMLQGLADGGPARQARPEDVPGSGAARRAADALAGRRRQQMASLGLRSGGKVEGPGGPTDDLIPAMLSDGEYVLPADTVEQVGVENLEALRKATHTPVAKQKKGSKLRMANGGPLPLPKVEEMSRNDLMRQRIQAQRARNTARATERAAGTMGIREGATNLADELRRPAPSAPAPAAPPSAPAPAATQAPSRRGTILRGASRVAAPVAGTAFAADTTRGDIESGYNTDFGDRMGFDMDTAGGTAAATGLNMLRNVGDTVGFGAPTRIGQGISEAAPGLVDAVGDLTTGGGGGRLNATKDLLTKYSPLGLLHRVGTGDLQPMKSAGDFLRGAMRDTDRQQFEQRQQRGQQAAPETGQGILPELDTGNQDMLTPGSDPNTNGLRPVDVRDPEGNITGFSNTVFRPGGSGLRGGEGMELGAGIDGNLGRSGDQMNNFTGRGRPQSMEERMLEAADARTRSLLRQQSDLNAAQITRENNAIRQRDDRDIRGPDEQARRDLRASQLGRQVAQLRRQGRAPEARALLEAERAVAPARESRLRRGGEETDQIGQSLANVTAQLGQSAALRENERQALAGQRAAAAQQAKDEATAVRQREREGLASVDSYLKEQLGEDSPEYKSGRDFFAKMDPREFNPVVAALTGERDGKLDSMYSLPPAALRNVTANMMTLKQVQDKINKATGGDLNFFGKPKSMSEAEWADVSKGGLPFTTYLRKQLPFTNDNVLRTGSGQSVSTNNISAEEWRVIRDVFGDPSTWGQSSGG
jgi:hypothetical protein